MGTEQDIIKQFKPVIQALIPYQQQGRLLEGLNRFSSRLDAKARNIIKEEVIRLTSQTDAPADNSAFAQFPVKKFAHFGIQMTLDKVGSEILKRETARYLDQYTIGVFESITSSDHYQHLVKRQLREKIINAFTVQSQSFEDIHFGDDLSVTPNFSVSSPVYQNGRSVSVVALSANSLTISFTRPPTFTETENVPIVMPAISGLCQLNQVIHYDFCAIEFNSRTQRHDARFTLSENDQEWHPRIKQYLERIMLRFPLERDLEIERAMQATDRDRIVQHSPWVPIFLEGTNDYLRPKIAKLTVDNIQRYPSCRENNWLPGKNALQRILQELRAFKEVFVLRVTVPKEQGKAIQICATTRQLERQPLLSSVIHLGMEHQSLEIWQYRLQSVQASHIDTAMTLQDIKVQDSANLSTLNHILFIRSVTEQLGILKNYHKVQPEKLPRSFMDAGPHWELEYVMDADMDRRKHPRFNIAREAQVKAGILATYPAIVKDISAQGIKLQLQVPQDAVPMLPRELKVTVPAFKLRGQRYNLLAINSDTLELRLQIAQGGNTQKLVSQIALKAANFTPIENLRSRQTIIYRYLWELTARNFANAAILVVTGRQMYQRLKTVYLPLTTNDLHPFSPSGQSAPTHGILADMDKSPPDSSVLKSLLQQAERFHLTIHCERKSDQRLISLTAHQCFDSGLREQIKTSLTEQELMLYVTSLDCQKIQSPTTIMTKQRLALLSKIDIDVYEKLLTFQQNYSHVLHVIDVSPLLHQMMLAGVVPTEELTTVGTS